MENLEVTKPDFENLENWTINVEIDTNPNFLIWKQRISRLRGIYNLFETKIELPKNSSILSVKVAGDDLNMWFKFNPVNKDNLESYTIRIVGTGFETPTDGFSYIDTIIDGMFVWHIFIKQTD